MNRKDRSDGAHQVMKLRSGATHTHTHPRTREQKHYHDVSLKRLPVTLEGAVFDFPSWRCTTFCFSVSVTIHTSLRSLDSFRLLKMSTIMDGIVIKVRLGRADCKRASLPVATPGRLNPPRTLSTPRISTRCVPPSITCLLPDATGYLSLLFSMSLEIALRT